MCSEYLFAGDSTMCSQHIFTHDKNEAQTYRHIVLTDATTPHTFPVTAQQGLEGFHENVLQAHEI